MPGLGNVVSQFRRVRLCEVLQSFDASTQSAPAPSAGAGDGGKGAVRPNCTLATAGESTEVGLAAGLAAGLGRRKLLASLGLVAGIGVASAKGGLGPGWGLVAREEGRGGARPVGVGARIVRAIDKGKPASRIYCSALSSQWMR
mmetsp:Transcript_47801/g.88950  ORF Transcript_47801/g.88950 Transcript_47801/m.88950 type:complete len:144 (-) Transcript_47801:199-630(-)